MNSKPEELIFLVFLDDIMRRNSKFEETCYQKSFLYYCRYMQCQMASQGAQKKDIFKKVDNSLLTSIGSSSRLRKLRAEEEVIVPYGGFLISGKLSKMGTPL